MSEDGCEFCRARLRSLHQGDDLEMLGDCADSFKRVNDYFHAQLKGCPRCSAIWLEGYHEDFTDVPIEDEWGKRTWIYRTLTARQVTEIRSAQGTRTLDLDTFGASSTQP